MTAANPNFFDADALAFTDIESLPKEARAHSPIISLHYIVQP
jgi:hypothetical protein